MSITTPPLQPPSDHKAGVLEAGLFYPESDGQPMAEKTEQFQWIVTIQGNLDGWFRNREDAFVAGNLLWYPVEGQPWVRTAPDVLVVFGRPKGRRGSYLQWKEAGIAPQVVFEIWSPSNKQSEKEEKLAFYDCYGVEEYYAYDPETGEVEGWIRQKGKLAPIAEMRGFSSPRLGIRFELEDRELALYLPDGRKFETPVELMARVEAEQAAEALARAEAERVAKEAAWAKLRELDIDPESL
jgi:Uma2 family endonuclease